MVIAGGGEAVPSRLSRWRARSLALAIASTAALTLILTVGFAAPAHAAPPNYTALGDSFSSGTGTRTYIADGTSCQRSTFAYPYLDAARLGATLTFAACSGARIPDVLNNQLGSLNASTNYVTISIGGNDAGFANVITQCALPWPFTCTSQINTANTYIANTLPGALNNVYSQIRTRAPNARVVVVGYPRLFNESDCQQLARISPAEQRSLNDTANRLHNTISARAAAHGFGYVDPRGAFDPHRICSSSEWINGLSNPVGESYHPNRTGQANYANMVESALRAGVAAANRRNV
jgi:lysophospholipase L1-like esterase